MNAQEEAMLSKLIITVINKHNSRRPVQEYIHDSDIKDAFEAIVEYGHEKGYDNGYWAGLCEGHEVINLTE